MARKLKSKAVVGAKAVKRRSSKPVAHKVTRVPLDSVRLIEVEPTHKVWVDAVAINALYWKDADDAIVKIVPPPGTPESQVISLERSFYNSGAQSVRVMPVQEEVRISVEGEVFDFSGDDDDRSLRQVVMDRVDRATNSQDQHNLRELCSRAMDETEGA